MRGCIGHRGVLVGMQCWYKADINMAGAREEAAAAAEAEEDGVAKI